MAFSMKLTPPSGVYGLVGQSGTQYALDSAGNVNITVQSDVGPALAAGFVAAGASQAFDNLAAITDPLVTNDNTQDYGVGSLWINTTDGRIWTCASAATGAAIWRLSSQNIFNFRNLLEGGDFTINPFQRNIAGLASANVLTATIANTVTYFADRWFAVGGASSSITLTKTANTTVPGFGNALRLQRTSSNANTAAISMGQVMASAASIRAQGQQVTFSFWAAAGANFSAASGNITVKIIAGTGTDDTVANMIAASWTTQANVFTGTQTITSTMTRYQFTGTVPAATTQLGVQISFTPVGTAGTNDYVDFMGFQLEIGASASGFERRSPTVELELCQRYAFVVAEPASGVVVANGMISATNVETVSLAPPGQLRAAPTVTVSAGSFKFNIAGTLTAVGGGFAAGSASTASSINIVGSVTATVAQGTQLAGGGGSGYVVASADF